MLFEARDDAFRQADFFTILPFQGRKALGIELLNPGFRVLNPMSKPLRYQLLQDQ